MRRVSERGGGHSIASARHRTSPLLSQSHHHYYHHHRRRWRRLLPLLAPLMICFSLRPTPPAAVAHHTERPTDQPTPLVPQRTEERSIADTRLRGSQLPTGTRDGEGKGAGGCGWLGMIEKGASGYPEIVVGGALQCMGGWMLWC